MNTDLCWSNGEINRKLEIKTPAQLFCFFIHYPFPPKYIRLLFNINEHVSSLMRFKTSSRENMRGTTKFIPTTTQHTQIDIKTIILFKWCNAINFFFLNMNVYSVFLRVHSSQCANMLSLLQRFLNWDIKVSKFRPNAMIGRTFYGPTPYIHINTFRPLNLVIATKM